MIGSIDPSNRKVVVIGGGICGLLAAYRLGQKGYEITLFEKAERLGGLLKTETLEGHGISESAAHSLLASREVLRLFSELGVETVPLRPDSRRRFIFRGRAMRTLPLGPLEILEMIGRVLFVRAKTSYANLGDWGRRHLGSAAARHLLTAFTRGVYGTGPEELSLEAAFPKLRPKPGKTLFAHVFSGALKRSEPRPAMIALREGMQSLVEALADKLRKKLGDRLRLGERAADLPQDANCVLAVPADKASSLLKSCDPPLSEALARVSYSGILSVTVFAEKKSFPKKIRGVGVLMSPDSACACLGILFNSSAFPERVQNDETTLSLTFMLPASVELDNVEALIRRDLHLVFGFEPSAELRLVPHAHPNAIPKYNRALQEAWQLANAGWCRVPGHVLFGNYSGGLSLRALIESSARLGEPSQ